MDGQTSTAAQNDGDQPKRRACDECRDRKLACTKEPDGCTRCKREGAVCHYSPQKQMGRPRKARRGPPHADNESAKPPAQVPDGGDQMDVDLSFLDQSESFNFLDFITSTFPSAGDLVPQQDFSIPEPKTAAAAISEAVSNNRWPVGGITGHLADQINFDPDPPEAPELAKEVSLEEAAQFLPADVQEQVPGLTPASTGTPDTSSQIQTPPDGPQGPMCSCLPSLYLALDSLQRLPQEVDRALYVTRSASRVVHNAILCPVCSSTPLKDLQHGPPIRPFQSLMLIGAVLPSVANSYSRVLLMVDDEAARATADRRRIRLALADYGGFWGNMAAAENDCGASSQLDQAAMEPAMWRLTVRALLKIDVYGIQGAECGEEFSQVGLRDIIEIMEERGRERHRLLEAMLAHGTLTNIHNLGLGSLPGERPTCLKILDIAKHSLDHLVIA